MINLFLIHYPYFPMDPAIEFHDVHYELKNGRILLQKINFSVLQGETLVLLGRSGSGKTTLLKLVNRLLNLTSGRIIIQKKSIVDWDPIQLRRNIGYVIQEGGLFPHFTVEENISLVPTLLRWESNTIKRRVHELLELVGLNPRQFASRYPKELSGGQNQRVGVARALAADPPILLLDEPFASLDVITRNELQEEFRSLQKRLNKTVLFVTHDIKEAFYFASRIGIFQEGNLIFLDTPEKVLLSENPEVKSLVKSLR